MTSDDTFPLRLSLFQSQTYPSTEIKRFRSVHYRYGGKAARSLNFTRGQRSVIRNRETGPREITISYRFPPSHASSLAAHLEDNSSDGLSLRWKLSKTRVTSPRQQQLFLSTSAFSARGRGRGIPVPEKRKGGTFDRTRVAIVAHRAARARALS